MRAGQRVERTPTGVFRGRRSSGLIARWPPRPAIKELSVNRWRRLARPLFGLVLGLVATGVALAGGTVTYTGQGFSYDGKT